MKQNLKSVSLALDCFCPYRLSAPDEILQHGNQSSSLT